MMLLWKCVSLFSIITNVILSFWENLWFSGESIFLIRSIDIIVGFGVNLTKAICEHERYSWKLVVWCAMPSAGLIGPFFFCYEVGNTITVTGANYLLMPQQFGVPQLRARNDLPNFFSTRWGSPHFAKCVRDFLNTNFPNRWASQTSLLEWALRLPNLTPCDFFLWGRIKSRVYATKPLKLSELKERIRTACSELGEEMLQT